MNVKPNIEILKEPKGFIKGIELIITIFAFATAAGFIGRFAFTVQCLVKPTDKAVQSRPVHGDFNYPFGGVTIKAYVSEDKLCKNETKVVAEEFTADVNYKSDAQYFVFTGVVSMLFVLVATAYYVFFEDRAKDATSPDVGLFSFPVVDFLVTVVLVIFWFTSSIAWAAGLSGLKKATNQDSVFNNYAACTADYKAITKCDAFEGATYGSATVSVVFGFLNFFVWGGNLWFLFKETPWHSPRSSGVKGGPVPSQEPPIQDTPSASAI